MACMEGKPGPPSFAELVGEPIAQALRDMSIIAPTPTQTETISQVMAGKDTLVSVSGGPTNTSSAVLGHGNPAPVTAPHTSLLRRLPPSLLQCARWGVRAGLLLHSGWCAMSPTARANAGAC